MQVLEHAKEVMASLPPLADAARAASPPAYAASYSPAAASPAHAEADPAATNPPGASEEAAAAAAASKRKAAATPGSPAQVCLQLCNGALSKVCLRSRHYRCMLMPFITLRWLLYREVVHVCAGRMTHTMSCLLSRARRAGPEASACARPQMLRPAAKCPAH